ncbi:MAG: hypothetical protein FJ304_15785 [Planctomycetes bacterium]|nr:hypothetical protein [Planctomycetota bacterium]
MIAVLCPQCGIACDVPPELFTVEKTCPVCGGRFLPAAARRDAPAPPPPPPVLELPTPAPEPVPPAPSPIPHYPVYRPAKSDAPAPSGASPGRTLVGLVIIVIVVARIAGLFNSSSTRTPDYPTPQFDSQYAAEKLTPSVVRAHLIGTWRLMSDSSPTRDGYGSAETLTFRQDGTVTRSTGYGLSDVQESTYRLSDNMSLYLGLDSTTYTIVSIGSDGLTLRRTLLTGEIVRRRYSRVGS